MISVVLWWIFYCFICNNVQRTESVKIFQNLVAPQTSSWYTKFKPTVNSKTCKLIPEQGPCRSNISMWFFEPDAMNCSTFSWGGCQGNGNRFVTNSDCMGYCLSKPGKTRPRFCSLTFDYGFCFGSSQRWYYDSTWQVCKSTIYSGCGGNKNNFYSKEQCDQICRFGNTVTIKTTTVISDNKQLIINPERRAFIRSDFINLAVNASSPDV